MLRSAAPSLALAALLSGCTGGERAPSGNASPSSLAYDHVWTISTHNSYWVDRGVTGDLFASGVGERLLDQLLVDHVRGLELDIHPDPAAPHEFLVYHTTPGNGLCPTLRGCLGVVRAFHAALPQHEPLHIMLELKGVSAPTFDADHTIEDLDRTLEDELGGALYRPADEMDHCEGALGIAVPTLGRCAALEGWPAIAALRGRVLVAVMGNWNGLPGAQATKDWALYALHGPIRDRAAFPMASSWQLSYADIFGTERDLLSQPEIDAAFEESIFMQIEDIADPHVAPFLARHGVIRVDSSFSQGDQAARAALGMQLLQTDTPWVQWADRGLGGPLRALRSRVAADDPREPGSRLRLDSGVPASAMGSSPSEPGERSFAYVTAAPVATTTWEAAVASGSDARRIGCLRAADALGAAAKASITVCRSKLSAVRTATGGSADAEHVILAIETCSAGACATTTIAPTGPGDDGGVGDWIRMVVTSDASGSSCAEIASAGSADRQFALQWREIARPCAKAPLIYQGLATPASPSAGGAGAYFFAARRFDGVAGGPDGAAHELAIDDFTQVVAEPATGDPRSAPELLSDASLPTSP